MRASSAHLMIWNWSRTGYILAVIFYYRTYFTVLLQCSLIWPGAFDQTIVGPCHDGFRGNITELFAVEWEVMRSLESGRGADMYDGLVERRQACERCNVVMHLRYVNIKRASRQLSYVGLCASIASQGTGVWSGSTGGKRMLRLQTYCQWYSFWSDC